MKHLLLILLVFIISPVSNEQIQQNMGFQQPEVVRYQQESYQQKAPKAWIETIVVNGKIIRYHIGAFSGIVYVTYDELGLSSSTYSTYEDFLNAIQNAIRQLPLGTPLCLLPFSLLYLLKKKKENE